jgi:hypothetical protein
MNTLAELQDNHLQHVLAHNQFVEMIHEAKMALKFPRDKDKIAKLSHDEKIAWYAYQFFLHPGGLPYELTTPEFASFWKWRVLIPMKIKRFAYKVKNWQFKKHKHITQMSSKDKISI